MYFVYDVVANVGSGENLVVCFFNFLFGSLFREKVICSDKHLFVVVVYKAVKEIVAKYVKPV